MKNNKKVNVAKLYSGYVKGHHPLIVDEGAKIMKQIKAMIVKSTRMPGYLSIRDEKGKNIRYSLTKAGFKPGDTVIIQLEKSDDK